MTPMDQPTLEQFLREQFYTGHATVRVRTAVRSDGRVHLTIVAHDGTAVTFDVRQNLLVAR
jgi:hypothetical protein